MKLRRLTSLILLFSFIVMSFTGIVLFFVPQGKVAYWINWKFLGLTKTQYGDIHTSFMVLFLIFGFIHIYLNWNAILSYLKNKMRKISFTKSEFVISLIVTVLFFIGSMYKIQPFKAYFDFESHIKNSWIKSPAYQPPYGHAEESSLSVFCKRLSIDVNKALALLKEKGIKVVSPSETLKEIAKANRITPMQVYLIIKPITEAKGKEGEGTIYGLGKKTLKELADKGFIKLKRVQKYLKSKGVEITPGVTLKDIADKLNTTPYQLFENLKDISK